MWESLPDTSEDHEAKVTAAYAQAKAEKAKAAEDQKHYDTRLKERTNFLTSKKLKSIGTVVGNTKAGPSSSKR